MKRKPPARPPLCAHSKKQPDNPFLETLFAAMCRNLLVLPGETFVEQVGRWITLWRFTADLQPRNEQEWLQAATVTTNQGAAAYHVVMLQLPRLTREQRAYHDQSLVVASRAAETAMEHYRQLRRSYTG